MLSIFVALYILKNALGNFKTILDLFLEKIPQGISVEEIKEHLLKIKGVINVHHIHMWSIDGYHHYATMHIVINSKNKDLIGDIF